MEDITELELDLSDRKLTDQELVDFLDRKPHLTVLDVSSNSALTSLAPVSKLTRLEKLYIGDTSIVDLSPLKELWNLKVFNADDTQISDISPLINSRRLHTLILTSTKVDNRVLDLVRTHFWELTELSLADTNVKGDIFCIKRVCQAKVSSFR